jgi:type III restriction enzyme
VPVRGDARQKLNQAEVLIENWHTLMPLKEQDRSVVKKGKESDEAYTRRVLGKLATYKDLIVINDEAHHAYRKPAEVKISKKEAEEQGIDLDEATRWIEGLDRIHKTRRIQRCFDLSATPFAPTGRTNTEAGLFDWVVSDFGLNDAIEAGLGEDAACGGARRCDAQCQDAAPQAVPPVPRARGGRGPEPQGRTARSPARSWCRRPTPCWAPTGARLRRSGPEAGPPVATGDADGVQPHRNGGAGGALLSTRAMRTGPSCTRPAPCASIPRCWRRPNWRNRQLDKDYEARLKDRGGRRCPTSAKQPLRSMKKEELLRELVDTVGKRGQAGQDLQNVVSVAMLSEGWDAKNVTHIMGCAPSPASCLCEQVIGRGLRRVAYDTDENGLFLPEFVNVFGVPLSIAMQPGDGGHQPATAQAQYAD